MEDTITTIYCLCDDFLKAAGHHDDPQARLSTAEVMTVALTASASFGANIDKTRLFLHEHGYMPNMVSKSRLNRRLHAIDPSRWEALFAVLATVFKETNDSGEYVVDSFPVPVCDNIRIRRCRLYQGEEFRGYIASKKRFFYGLRVHMIVTAEGASRLSSSSKQARPTTIWPSRASSWTWPRGLPSTPTSSTTTTITRISCKKRHR